jgi:hypothetical protein
MRIFILLLLCSSVNAQIGRFSFSSANVATSEYREDIMYLFDGDNKDETPNGNDFTNTGITFTTTAPTPIQGSHCGYSSGSTGTYFTLPVSYSDVFPGDFTITMWIYTTQTANLRLTQSGNPYVLGFNTRFNSTGNDMDVFTNTTEVNATNFLVPSTNVWFHLGISYESSTGYIHIYVNGVEQTDAVPGLGATGVTLDASWHILNSAIGWIDDFRVFSEILPESEVDDIKDNPGVPLNDI